MKPIRLLYFLFLLSISSCALVKPAAEPRPPQATAVSTALALQPTPPPTETAAALPSATLTSLPTETAVTAAQPPPPTTTEPIEPSETSVPPTLTPTLPTSTPEPTETATPTPSRTPISAQDLLHPIINLGADEQLPIPYDLLFLQDGRLNLWEPNLAAVTVFTPTAPYKMNSWQMTPDQQKVLIAQTAVGNRPGFILSLFDTQTRELQDVWQESEQFLLDYAIATDGNKIAAITSLTPPEEREGNDTVQVLDVASGRQETIINCSTYIRLQYSTVETTVTNRCNGLVAVPDDNEKWLWSDVLGVWEGGTPYFPTLIVSNLFELPPRFHTPTTDWSSNGRYQLLRSRRSKGEDRRVLDMVTQTVVPIPNSTVGLDQAPQWQWTADNHLFGILPTRSNGEGIYNFVELLRVVDGQLEESDLVTIPDPYGSPITAATQLSDGRFSFIINYNKEAEPEIRNIYLLNNFDQEPYPFVSLPPVLTNPQAAWQAQFWTPDGQAVLYQKVDAVDQENTYIYYFIPASGSALIDLTAVLGSKEAEFLWIP